MSLAALPARIEGAKLRWCKWLRLATRPKMKDTSLASMGPLRWPPSDCADCRAAVLSLMICY